MSVLIVENKSKAKDYDKIKSGSCFGVFNDCYIDAEDKQVNLNLASELGNQLTRLTLTWDLVEPKKGVWTFKFADAVIRKHIESGIQPLINIHSLSSWATRPAEDIGKKRSSVPLDMELYERFLRKTVERYKESVKYWQIENEIYDNSRFWAGSREEYVNLLKHAYRTIKGVDPEARVVLAGFANLMFRKISEGDKEIKQFYEYLMREANRYFDVIDIHQYYKPETVYSEISVLKQTMKKNGFYKEIICTEAGDLDLRLFPEHTSGREYSAVIEDILSIKRIKREYNRILTNKFMSPNKKYFCLSDLIKSNPKARRIVERYQSANLVKRFTISLSQGISQIHWLCMKDSANIDWFHTMMCLADSDGRKKPHFYTYKMLIDNLSGYNSVSEISKEPKIIKFDFPEKSPVYIVWSENDQEVDMSGNIDSSNVRVSYLVTELDAQNRPKYLPDKISSSSSVKINDVPVLVKKP